LIASLQAEFDIQLTINMLSSTISLFRNSLPTADCGCPELFGVLVSPSLVSQ